MMFKSASVIAVIAAVGTLSAYGAPIGYSERTSGHAIAINRDVHQTVAPIDISLSEIARRIVSVTTQQDEPHTPRNEKRTGPPNPPGVRPQSPEHYRNMQTPGGSKGIPMGGMPPPPNFRPSAQNGTVPPGAIPPGFCPCATALQPNGNSTLTPPGGDQDQPGGLPPPPLDPETGAPADDNEPGPTDNMSDGVSSTDAGGVPPPVSQPEGVKPPGAPSPTTSCDDTPTSTPDDSNKKRYPTRSEGRVPRNKRFTKAVGEGLGVRMEVPEPETHIQHTNESRDDWKRIPPKFIRRHVPPSVLNSNW